MSAPYLTICILCVLLGIAFLYRFCLVFQSSREGYETGASKTIGSREIQMDYYTIEENENGLLAVFLMILFVWNVNGWNGKRSGRQDSSQNGHPGF